MSDVIGEEVISSMVQIDTGSIQFFETGVFNEGEYLYVSLSDEQWSEAQGRGSWPTAYGVRVVNPRMPRPCVKVPEERNGH